MKAVLTDPMSESLWESQRKLNQAQAEQLRILVNYVESFLRETEVIDPHLMRTARGRSTVESAAIMNAAEALAAGEGHVFSQYQQARFARQHLPGVWDCTRRGDVSVRSLLRVVSAAEKLQSPVSLERLDRDAAAYAVSHRPAQLNAWLSRFVARVEPEHQARRCHLGHAERRVWLEHLDDGLSILHAMLPTLTAEAIKNRLVDVARSPRQAVPYDPCVERPLIQKTDSGRVSGATDWLGLGHVAEPSGATVSDSAPVWASLQTQGCRTSSAFETSPTAGGETLPTGAATARTVAATSPTAGGENGHSVEAGTNRPSGDPRTQAQREADLLSCWLLTGGTDSGIPINGHIGLLITAESLRGISDAPAVSRNRRHAYPAEMIRRIVGAQQHQLAFTPVPGAFEATGFQNPPRGDLLTEDPPPDDIWQVVMERVYHSRFVPRVLRRLIEFRDGTCQAPGCTVAAEHCDIDHRLPWPRGETTAANLWALCRKHHRLKTAGLLEVPDVREPLPTA
ncbi:HNH endonuclease signature motif containing protein [Nesterenkonia sp. Act20]|uniref:HNH endonuclease signature motif containing protein n=1 Tax=Nesterenkonia sp. Act20 TaxID=1483432 RepID=UPI001C46652F|nr:HNH endonuclease signature motif containing protein [Nesterenkonia sp. Act20]